VLVLKKTDGKVLKKTVGVSFEKNLGEFSISGVFSGMMMIFSLFSFRALSLFKFNVHFNFHFHFCGDGSVVVEVVDEVTGHRFGSKSQARQCASKL
jgi:hypothetical protein